MADESKGIDPYEAALADLYQRREQLNQAIGLLESIRGGTVGASAGTASGVSNGAGAGSTKPETELGSLLGLSIVDAAKKLLAQHRRPLKNPEIATLFKQGGLHLNSKDWTNTIGAVLTRRFQEIGDIVRVDRGTFGLKEWYPNRSFGKKDATKPESAEKGEAEAPKIIPPPPEPPRPFRVIPPPPGRRPSGS